MEAATLIQIASIVQIVILVLIAPTLVRVFGPRLMAWLASRWSGHEVKRITSAVGEEAAPVPSAALAEGHRWLIVGASGSGKSTAARGMIRDYLAKGAEVLILDPEGAAWPKGARMVGAPDDFDAIGAELVKVGALATVRRAQFMRGVRTFAPLLVVIEEAPAVLQQSAGSVAILSDLARRGRKLSIHLLMLAQDTQAKTLKLEGQLQLLTNFRRLETRKAARGIELIAGDRAVSLVPFDDDRDLVLPTATPDADRLLAGLNTSWVGTPTSPTTASERQETAPSAPTTTTAIVAENSEIEASPTVVVGAKGVTIAEQVAILRAALKLEAEGKAISRSEVCRQVFDGQTGGAAYNKVKAVLDAAEL
jgi:Type IV secretion-system coupling protein DNA-binding domain